MDASKGSLDSLSYTVIGAALRIHSELASGMRESVYEAALAAELRKLGHNVEVQVIVPVEVGGRRIKKGFRADLLVDGKLVVEVKCAKLISEEHIRQVATYLKLMRLKLALILNFGARSLRYGIRRVVNGL